MVHVAQDTRVVAEPLVARRAFVVKRGIHGGLSNVGVDVAIIAQTGWPRDRWSLP